MSTPQQTFHSIDERNVPERRTGDYTADWRAYRIRRGLALTLLYGCIPFSLAIGIYLGGTLDRPIWSVILIALWCTAMSLAIWWAGEFRCPRCRRRRGALGSRKGFSTVFRGLFDSVCSNCKLHRFARH